MAIFFLITIFISYISLGLPDSVLGVAWPHARLELGVSSDYAGLISMTITLCAVFSSVYALRLSRKLSPGLIIAISSLMTGVALLCAGFLPKAWMFFIIAVPLGFGAGAVDAMVNDYVSQHYSSRIMSWVHASWGLGAMLSPLIITACLGSSWRLGFYVVGGIQIALSVLFFATLKLWNKEQPLKHESVQHIEPRRPELTLKNIAPWLGAICFFLYCGIENSLGLWLKTYMYEFRGYDVAISGAAVSVYYGAIMCGRVGFGVFTDKLGNINSIRLGLIISLVGACIFFINSPISILIAVFLIGIGYAPIYPCLMHETARRFNPEISSKAIGFQMAGASLGMLAVSPSIGYIGTATTMMALVYAVFAGIFLLTLVCEILNRLTKSLPSEPKAENAP